ncbi:MAG: aspartate--tRNA(Asn) ligase [Eubacteriales bacterium]|nr:aspartate--tRNA(Asn) ligase [Eubacteriales bacterium]
MKRTWISEAKMDEPVLIQGFVEHIRNTRNMAFLVVRDFSGKLQVTIEKSEHPEWSSLLDTLTVESVVSLEGILQKNAQVKLEGRELIPSGLTIESLAAPLPLTRDANIDTRLDYRWLDLRGEKERLLFEVQTCLVQAMREYLLERRFLEIHTPKLIAAASESGADVFEVNYFDRKAYLAQSPQFYKQMAMAAGFERIFETGPVFRAEKSYTNRHTTEFTGFDLEFSYIESFHDVMELEAEMLAFALTRVQSKFGEDIERLYGTKVIVPKLPFPEIALSELYCELERRYGYHLPEKEQGDTTTEAEQLSYRFAMEEFGHEFLFVYDFAAEKRAFYHMRKNGIPQGYDLIWRGVEITTGAQREHRYDVLCRQAEEKGLGEDVKFYTEFFRYGCPPHGGFGLGVDRLTMLLLGTGIKEAMFLFRGPNRLTP